MFDFPSDCPPYLECAALVVYSEARGEPLLGQLLVAKTLINRAVVKGTGLCEEADRYKQFIGFEALKHPGKVDRSTVQWKTSALSAYVAARYLWNVHSFCGIPLFFRVGNGSVHEWNGYPLLCVVGNHSFYGRLASP